MPLRQQKKKYSMKNKMYSTDKIEVFDFGAIHYVIQTIYCFQMESTEYEIYFIEINLN